ncbi:hypothetical protein [Cribrihabitans pelagius]|uniref:hypothetical protein n=1 Tax=Cribrihabitans pelagius TaxID=1765746 RepID=UPI003B595812
MDAKSCVPVQHGGADLDFRGLPLEVSGHQGLAKQLDTVGHLRKPLADRRIT